MGETSIAVPAAEPKRPSYFSDLMTRLVKEQPLGTAGAIIVLILFLTGIFADLLAPYAYDEAHLGERLQPPSTTYVLGTDEFGRDLLSRVIYGARVSMVVAVAGIALCAVVATLIGLVSGYLGGRFDMLVQRFVDAWLCFPQIFLMLSVMAIVGPGMLQVIIVLGLRFGIVGSRIVRSAVIAIKQNLYIQASIAIGAPTSQILARHILPNVMAPIIVLVSTRMASLILAEATLSFLGYGLPPPIPSWGGMLSGAGRSYFLEAPWMVIWPGLALSLVVYGINMFGDSLRDLLDPKLRGNMGASGEAKVGRTRPVQAS